MIEIVYITNIYYFQPKWLRKKYKYTVKYLLATQIYINAKCEQGQNSRKVIMGSDFLYYKRKLYK